jgi:hypothetical protein
MEVLGRQLGVLHQKPQQRKDGMQRVSQLMTGCTHWQCTASSHAHKLRSPNYRQLNSTACAQFPADWQLRESQDLRDKVERKGVLRVRSGCLLAQLARAHRSGGFSRKYDMRAV